MSGRPDQAGAGGFGLHRMIVVSVALHLLILFLLVLSPSFPSPKLTFGPVYTVSLVSAPATIAPPPSTSALARELLKEDHPEAVLKKQAAPEPVVPIRPLEPRKKQEADLERAMAEIRKKAAAQTVVRSPAKAAPEKPAPAEPAPAPAAATPGPGDALLNAQMRVYYGQIWTRIRGGWALPEGMLRSEVLETVVHVTILRSGAVAEVGYEKRSGNRYFDESALKAVRKAAPFPPLPAGIGEGSVDIGIRFHYPEPKS